MLAGHRSQSRFTCSNVQKVTAATSTMHSHWIPALPPRARPRLSPSRVLCGNSEFAVSTSDHTDSFFFPALSRGTRVLPGQGQCTSSTSLADSPSRRSVGIATYPGHGTSAEARRLRSEAHRRLASGSGGCPQEGRIPARRYTRTGTASTVSRGQLPPYRFRRRPDLGS